eukprot:gene15815-7125_t
MQEKTMYYKKHLKHENIVEFKGMCLSEKALMLGYAAFDFGIFGKSLSLSSLHRLLCELDKCHFKEFEHLIPSIAHQIIEGLSYLHGQGVPHRDLKPGNVLVSNQHLNEISPTELQKVWKEKPCQVLLTDFGESWGNIGQSSQRARTHTKNIYKEADMKMSDIWSLGIQVKITNGILLKESVAYNHLQASYWYKIEKIFLKCVKVDPVDRPFLNTIQDILAEELRPDSYPFSLHQGTALVKAQEENMFGGFLRVPKKNGTNACMFLSLKSAEMCLQMLDKLWECLKNKAEHIIHVLPSRINHLRDTDKPYEVNDAYQLMRSNEIISECLLHTHCEGHPVFSAAGKKQLEKVLCQKKGVFIVTFPPYSFVLCKHIENWIAIDTHVIGESLGGNGNGILMVFKNEESTAHWIWRRLAENMVKSSILQITEIHLAVEHVNEIRIEEATYRSASTNLEATDCKDGGHFSISSDSEVAVTSFFPSINDRSTVDHQLDMRCQSSVNGDMNKTYSGANQEKLGQIANNVPSINDVLNVPATWEKMCQDQWGPCRIPYFQVSRKLKNEEALALVMSNCSRARKIPQACRKSAVFLLDTSSVKDPNDVKSDLNGVFRIFHEVKSLTVSIKNNSKDEGVTLQVKARKKLKLQEDGMHLMVNRRENDCGFIRNIMYFLGRDEKIVGDSIVLLNRAICGNIEEIQFDVPAHGNARHNNRRSQFHPLKKSTLDAVHQAICPSEKTNSGRIYDNVTKCVINTDHDYGDIPRSKKQIIDLSYARHSKERRNSTNEVEALLAYNEGLGDDGIILLHSDIPSDLWVLSNKRMLFDSRRSEGGLPISVEPTFNFGKFELSIALPLIIYADVIERKAIELLNSKSTIVPVPSLGNDKGAKKYMVAGSKASSYKVSKTAKGKVTCNCKGFKFASLCKHSVAVAEKEGTLATVIKNAKLARKSARSTLTYPNERRRAGRKAHQPRRLSVYEQREMNPSSYRPSNASPPFTKIWHNDEPFVVWLVK